MKENLKKNFIWNTIGSTFYAFSSLFLLIIVTRINGVEDAGVFTFGFSLANLLLYLALYYGRVYQVANNVKCSNKDFTITRMLTSLFMLLISAIFVLSRLYDWNKGLIIFLLCFWKFSESIFENYYAVFQSKNQLYKVGTSQFLKSFLEIIIFLIVNIYTKNLLISLISIIIVNYLIFIFYDIPQIEKKDFAKKLNWKNVFLLIKIGVYPFLISFLMMYLSTAEKFIIDYKLSDSLQAIFGIIIMPASVVAMFVNYIIQPFILQIKKDNLENNFFQIKKTIKKMIGITAVFGFVAVVLGWLLGCEILGIIYDLDISNYKTALVIILIGAILYGISIILSTILTTFNETKKQALSYFFVSVLTTIIAFALILKLNLTGAAIAYLISMIILSILLLIILKNYFKKRKNN